MPGQQRLLLLIALVGLVMVAAVRGDCGGIGEGETWQTGPPETCAEYTCKDGTLRGLTCPVYKVHWKCKQLPIPEGAVYPACCPHYDCPENLDD